VQVCQERIIICVCVQPGLLQLFRTRLAENRACSTGSGVRAWCLPQGYDAGLRPNAPALPEWVCVCPIPFIMEILMLQLHANSIDRKVCVPPNAVPLALAAALGQRSKHRREETR